MELTWGVIVPLNVSENVIRLVPSTKFAEAIASRDFSQKDTMQRHQLCDLCVTLCVCLRSGTRKVTINITGNDHFFLGLTPVNRDQLKQYLTNMAAEQSRSGKPLEVNIRTDRRVPYRAIEPLLVICSQAGIDSVSFNTSIDGNK